MTTFTGAGLVALPLLALIAAALAVLDAIARLLFHPQSLKGGRAK